MRDVPRDNNSREIEDRKVDLHKAESANLNSACSVPKIEIRITQLRKHNDERQSLPFFPLLSVTSLLFSVFLSSDVSTRTRVLGLPISRIRFDICLEGLVI